MTTLAKRAKASKNIQTRKPAALKIEVTDPKPEGQFSRVALSEIDFSDHNRKIFNPGTLGELAANIKLNDVIESLTLRLLPGGRYEVVAGERRLRAARMAGLLTVPAIIRELTDKQANEIRLSENLQRENPHPIETAYMVGLMQQDGYKIQEISLRLGKSVSFVYNCIKLSELITEVQQLFIENKIGMQDALGIASLSLETQQEFYTAHLSDPERTVANIKYLVDRYKADLTRAPFDTKSKKLLPEVGACTTCPFNSATLKSLFPELAKEAICTNKSCYQSKCRAQLVRVILKTIAGVQLDGIIISYNTSDDTRVIIDSLPETSGITQYQAGEIGMLNPPNAPDKDDYMDDFTEEEEVLDEQSYLEAVKEYEEDLITYNSQVESGKYLKGLLCQGTEVKLICFSPEKSTFQQQPQKVTAQFVKEAIKAGTATPELIDQEIQRLSDVETRKKEIDRENVQAAVHAAFLTDQEKPEASQTMTAVDQVAIRLLVYQALSYQAREKANKMLLPLTTSYYHPDPDALYEALQNISEPDYTFLIRMAVAGNGDSIQPGNITSQMLYKLAEAAGTDVAAIEARQQEITDKREARLQERIAENEAKKAKLAM